MQQLSDGCSLVQRGALSLEASLLPETQDALARCTHLTSQPSTPMTGHQTPLLLVAVILALAALMMKVKLAAWASLITVLSAVANTPFGTADSFKHTVSAVTFSVVSVAACYIVPVRASP